MPELPEVETVKKGLEAIFDQDLVTIDCITSGEQKLRFHSSLELFQKVKNQKLNRLSRKAKYILFELDDFVLLSHLGMTGSWRLEKERRKHDHIRIFFKDGRVLVYNDPRRFGMFEILNKENWQDDPKIQSLGLDPVVDSGFTADWLYKKTRGRKGPIKNFIMNQSFIVGVGNIYASEALFLAGIRPRRSTGRLSFADCEKLVRAIQEVLLDAICWGGSTISDFKQAGGSEGYFQNLLLVYGREAEACLFCGQPVRSAVLAGRSSFWCPDCQK